MIPFSLFLRSERTPSMNPTSSSALFSLRRALPSVRSMFSSPSTSETAMEVVYPVTITAAPVSAWSLSGSYISA